MGYQSSHYRKAQGEKVSLSQKHWGQTRINGANIDLEVFAVMPKTGEFYWFMCGFFIRLSTFNQRGAMNDRKLQ